MALNGTGHPQPAAGKFRWPDKGIFRGKGHGRWMIFVCEFETFIMAYYNPISGQYHPLIPANNQGFWSHFESFCTRSFLEKFMKVQPRAASGL